MNSILLLELGPSPYVAIVAIAAFSAIKCLFMDLQVFERTFTGERIKRSSLAAVIIYLAVAVIDGISIFLAWQTIQMMSSEEIDANKQILLSKHPTFPVLGLVFDVCAMSVMNLLFLQVMSWLLSFAF